jgi:nitroreductase
MGHPLDPDMAVVEAVVGRRSVRRFRPIPVSDDMVRAILTAASRAPSGTNIQPWLVHIVSGAAQERLSVAATAAA